MRKSDFLDRLLDGVDVEWKALGLVATIKTGQSVNKQMILANPGEYPVINSGREPLGFIGDWNTDHDPIGITTRGAGVGSVTWQDGKYFRGNLNYSVTIMSGQSIEIRYLYHMLLEMQPEIQSLCTYDGIPALNAGALKELQIPIPCPDNPKKSLEIQAEIVRILDAFTELTAELTDELTAELTARKKQYNYYRDQLLSFEDREVEWIPLGEIAKILNGYAFKSSMYCESGIRVIRISDVQKGQMSDANPKYYPTGSVDEIRKYLLEEGDLVMSLTGNAGRVAMLSKTDLPAGLNQRVACIRPISDAVTTRYLFHFLNQDYFENDAMANATGGGQKNMSTTWLASYLIPVPSPKDQSRIVEMLDRFDSFNNSLTEGLPREIELRQKQYEYYRDLLLSFQKSESTTA